MVSEQVRVVKLGPWLFFCIASLEPEGKKGSLTRYWPVLHDVVRGKVRFDSEGEKPYSITAERCFGSEQHKLHFVNVDSYCQSLYGKRRYCSMLDTWYLVSNIGLCDVVPACSFSQCSLLCLQPLRSNLCTSSQWQARLFCICV